MHRELQFVSTPMAMAIGNPVYSYWEIVSELVYIMLGIVHMVSPQVVISAFLVEKSSAWSYSSHTGSLGNHNVKFQLWPQPRITVTHETPCTPGRAATSSQG